MNTTRELYTIFVYGTLRKGFRNHRYLQNTIFIGLAKTVGQYQLRQTIIPYVSKFQQEGKTQITGEIYQLTKAQLQPVDRLEGHPHFYRRELIPVQLDSGKKIMAWVYFCEEGYGTINTTGDFAQSVNSSVFANL